MKRENINKVMDLLDVYENVNFLRGCLPQDGSGKNDFIRIQMGDDWSPVDVESKDFSQHFSQFLDSYLEHIYEELEKID